MLWCFSFRFKAVVLVQSSSSFLLHSILIFLKWYISFLPFSPMLLKLSAIKYLPVFLNSFLYLSRPPSWPGFSWVNWVLLFSILFWQLTNKKHLGTRLFRVICLENIAAGERFGRGLKFSKARYRSDFLSALFLSTRLTGDNASEINGCSERRRI